MTLWPKNKSTRKNDKRVYLELKKRDKPVARKQKKKIRAAKVKYGKL